MVDKEWLEVILKRSDRVKQISHVADIITENVVNTGDNYTSDIYRLKLTIILKSGSKCIKTFIAKKAHNTTDVFHKFSIYKREIMVYNDILEKMEGLMEEYQDSGDKLWCNMIGYNPFDFIVLEDLKATNFKIANRKKLLDLNHTVLCLHSLARFHAIAYVLIQKGLVNDNLLRKYFLCEKNSITTKYVNGGFRQLSNIMETCWSSEWKEIAKKIAKEEELASDKIIEIFLNVPTDGFVTLCHGDFWTCNVMFKYCPYDHSLPIAAKFIDLQFCHLNSYMHDIITFLYTSVQAAVRNTYYDKLLNVYQNSLVSTLEIYGVQHKAPTIEQIYAEAKRIDYLAFLYNAICMPVAISDLQNALIWENLTSEVDIRNPQVYNSDYFKSEVEEEIRKWSKNETF